MIRNTIGALVALTLAVAGFGAAIAAGGGPYDPPTTTTTTTTGGGHTPVTVCHKPGTPAQHEITFDDDGYEAHLAHGDTLGPCPDNPPTETEPTTPTETTPTTPTETTPTTPTPPRVCPDGLPPTQGEAAFDPNDDCKRPPTVTTTTTVTPTVTPTAAAATTPASPPTVSSTTATTAVKPAVKSKPTAKPTPDNPPTKAKPKRRVSTKQCPAPAYMLKGKCVRDYKGKPHPVAQGNG